MKRALTLSFFLALAAAACRRSAFSASPPPDAACNPADAYTAHHISTLKSLFASTDSRVIAWRKTTHLPAVADSAIEVVSNPATCDKALTTFYRSVDIGSSRPNRLYLIRAGAMYIASIPSLSPGEEFTSQLVLDGTFTHVATYGR